MADLQRALEWARNNPQDERSKKLLEQVASGKINTDMVQAKSIQQEHQASYSERLTEDVNRRADKIGEIQRSNVTGLSKGIQTLGQGMGAGADVIKQGFESITPEPVKNVLGKVMNKVGEVGSKIPVGYNINEGLITPQKIADKYVSEVEQKRPELAGNIEAVGNAVNLGLQLSGTAELPGQAFNATKRVLNTAGNIVSKSSGVAGSVAETATALGTGMERQTIQQIAKNPEIFSAKSIETFDKNSIASKAFKGIDDLETRYSETGKAYDPIRKSQGQVIIPKRKIDEALNKYGIGIDEKGKLIHTENSVPMSQGDLRQLQGWIDKYYHNEIKSPNSFLNARQASGKLANFQDGTTDVADKIGRDLYATLNETGRGQIKGLEQLDAKFSPLKEEVRAIKKDYFTSNGELKDNAYSKLFNLTNKNKESVLARMEKVSPGITEDLNILKAMEDIEAAKGNKIGTYLRGGTSGFIYSGGNPAMAIIGAIISSPQVAVPIIRAFAKTKNISSSVVNGIIGKMKSGKKLVGQELDIVNQAVDNASKKVIERAKNARPGMNIKENTTITSDAMLKQFDESLSTMNDRLNNTTDKSARKNIEKAIQQLINQKNKRIDYLMK